MFTIVSAVVEMECTDSWVWFFNLLSNDLGLEDKYGYTIISDQQKGIEIAISDILSRVEHRNCARHVFANWSMRKIGKSYEVFWGTSCKSDIVDNNLCETFNLRILEARFKSIIKVLEDIRTKMMNRIVQKRKLCNG
ncbi:hypothetical protein Goshw_014277 [Gossypium schwendimanii]|uniref:MULE transposase domain-containing protein n=1 Tax=Gossypium schwendimanii TaxID=34291 RepID=A0A7J9MI00_GOSSC|nr:hypothetical protein [Gossypium schwendimanii]